MFILFSILDYFEALLNYSTPSLEKPNVTDFQKTLSYIFCVERKIHSL